MDAGLELSPLAWLASTQFLLYGLGWGACSLLLREQRAAVAHWSAFMLLAGLGLLLTTMRGEPRTWWAFGGANAVLFAAIVALRRGAELFMKVPPHDREHALLLVLVAAAYALLGPDEANASARVLLALGGPAWLMLRLCIVLRRPVLAEYGRTVALALAAPAAVTVAAFGARIVQQALDMGRSLEMHRLDQANIGFLFVYVIGAAMYNFAFVALLTLRLVKRLQALSQRDPLTGLLNRRAFDAELQREGQRRQRGGPPFALLAIDVDHFKQVNDRHGHPAGDALLVQLAQRLQQTARQTDVVARTGGEEFVVIVPDAGADGARAAAQRMWSAVRATRFELPDGPLAATVSIGVACADRPVADPHDVLSRADQALYRAKALGRDRVCADGDDAAASLPGAAAAAASSAAGGPQHRTSTGVR